MRFFFACVFVLAATNSVLCMSESDEFLEELRLQAVRGYNQRNPIQELADKVEVICPGYGSQTPGMIQKVMTCWEGIDLDQETICSSARNHFKQCFKPMSEFFKECLPEKSKDIPEFVIEGFLKSFNYVCKTDGEHIFELQNTCVRTTNARTQRCLRRFETKMQQFNNKPPSKEDICEISKSMRGCIQSHLTASCGHQVTREAVLGLYDAFFSGCNSETTSFNEIEDLDWKNDKFRVAYQK